MNMNSFENSLDVFEEVLDLFSAGLLPEYIAEEVNLPLASVEAILIDLLSEDEDIFSDAIEMGL